MEWNVGSSGLPRSVSPGSAPSTARSRMMLMRLCGMLRQLGRKRRRMENGPCWKAGGEALPSCPRRGEPSHRGPEPGHWQRANLASLRRDPAGARSAGLESVTPSFALRASDYSHRAGRFPRTQEAPPLPPRSRRAFLARPPSQQSQSTSPPPQPSRSLQRPPWQSNSSPTSPSGGSPSSPFPPKPYSRPRQPPAPRPARPCPPVPSAPPKRLEAP